MCKKLTKAAPPIKRTNPKSTPLNRDDSREEMADRKVQGKKRSAEEREQHAVAASSEAHESDGDSNAEYSDEDGGGGGQVSPSGRESGESGLSGLEPEGAAPDAGTENARKLFFAKYQKPNRGGSNPPAQRFLKTGSGKPTVTVQGVVVRAREIVTKGRQPGQMVPKKEVSLILTKTISNNAEDFIASGVSGYEWLLPTYKPRADGDARDAGDDAPEGGGHTRDATRAASLPRHLSFKDEHHPTIQLDAIGRISFYTQAPGDKGEEKEGMSLVQPGMLVEVTGVVASLSEAGDQLWLNAATIAPLGSAVQPGTHARQIMNVISSPGVMAAHALRLSQTMGGFHGFSQPSKPEVEVQAQVFRGMWIKVRDGAVAACEARAMAIRGEHGGTGETQAAVLDQHAARLRGGNPADYAQGVPLFSPAYSAPDRPAVTAGIMMKPVSCEFPQHQFLWDLFASDASRDALPETFCAGEVNDVQLQGACLNVSIKITWIGSRTHATLAIKNGKDPTLTSGEGASCGALGIKLNMRELPTSTGLVVQSKANGFCKDLAMYADWFANAGITPRDCVAQGVTCVFPTAYGFHMVPSIFKVTALVSESWVKEHLALGEGQFAYEKDSDTAHLKDKFGVDLQLSLPNIKNNYYQEVTSSTWKFANARMPSDAPKRVYRIWYDGICERLADDPNLGRNADDGEALIREISSQMSGLGNQGKPITTFLHQHAALYAVAVEA